MEETEIFDECPICLEDLDNPKFLQCGHSFCRTCLDSITISPDQITCPICRAITESQECDTQRFMEYVSLSDRASSSKSERCDICRIIDSVIACEHCSNNFCEKCLTQHYIFYARPGSNELTERLCQSPIDVTTFWFNISNRIDLPKSNHVTNGMLNVKFAVIKFDRRTSFLIAPKGINKVLMLNGDKHFTSYEAEGVTGVAYGSTRHPLLIFKRTNSVFELEDGNLRMKFRTEDFLPQAISCMNNGRIVLVGKKFIMNNRSFDTISEVALYVYERNGTLVTHVIIDKVGCYNRQDTQKGEPTCICVNKETNAIYVGDARKKQILLFLEDGTLVSSQRMNDFPNLYLPSLSKTINVNSLLTFPSSLAYNQQCSLLFASSFLSKSADVEAEGSISVFSPSLDKLGNICSADNLGIPVCLSCDDLGTLYVADGEEGVIKVFILSEFDNIFRKPRKMRIK